MGLLGDGGRKVAKGVFALGDLALGEWPGPRVLIYHQVTDTPSRQLDVRPTAFARQLQWLRANGSIEALDQVLAAPDRTGSSDHFVMTFDDGFRGLFDHAYPLMVETGSPFTLYITSGLVEDLDSGSDMLTWDHINQMQSSGLMTIGAHTHTHPDLRDLTADQVHEEVGTSNAIIESETGVRPRHFAYPKGYWSDTAEPVLRATYQSAVLGAGEPFTSETDPYRICRVPVQLSDGSWLFRRKLDKGMRLEEKMRSRLKGYENPPSRLATVGQVRDD